MAVNQVAVAVPRGIRPIVAQRSAAVVVAVALSMLGLYPGPMLVVLRDPAWHTNPAVRQLSYEWAFWITGLLIIVGPAVVLANMLPHRFDRVWDCIRHRLGAVRSRWFVTGTALFAALAAAGVAIYVLARRPTTSDEVAQLWHARILLTGRLSLPADPNPEFFAIDNVVDHGRWYSQFPIGGPAVLALAMLLHATWLLNPLLAGLTVVNVYRFASRAYGEREARLAAVLAATCPFLLLMSGSYMNHTPVVFFVTLALAELPAWTSDTDRRRAVASIAVGISLGLAIAIRPLDGAVATAVLGGYMLLDGVRHARMKPLLLTIAAGAIPIAWLLVSNWLTTGRPLRFGYEVLWGANHSLGFHDDPTGNPHTPARALQLAAVYAMQLNWSLFEWPIAGLVVVGGALVAIGRLGRWEALLLAWIGAQLAAYAAYWHAGFFFAPRYLFTAVPALLIIAARGLAVAEKKSSPLVRRSIVAGVGASMLGSWLIPAAPVGALGEAENARPLRAAFKLELEPLVGSLDGTKALVFVSETATARVMRRLWGLGLSRPDAARLIAAKDNCALLQAAADEAQRPGSPAEHFARLKQTVDYSLSAAYVLRTHDPTFRASDRQSYTSLCQADLKLDTSGEAISYGQALLLNEIGSDGRISGSVIFAADIGEHNEVLRRRFADRTWYRLQKPAGSTDRVPRLVPYK